MSKELAPLRGSLQDMAAGGSKRHVVQILPVHDSRGSSGGGGKLVVALVSKLLERKVISAQAQSSPSTLAEEVDAALHAAAGPMDSQVTDRQRIMLLCEKAGYALRPEELSSLQKALINPLGKVSVSNVASLCEAGRGEFGVMAPSMASPRRGAGDFNSHTGFLSQLGGVSPEVSQVYEEDAPESPRDDCSVVSNVIFQTPRFSPRDTPPARRHGSGAALLADPPSPGGSPLQQALASPNYAPMLPSPAYTPFSTASRTDCEIPRFPNDQQRKFSLGGGAGGLALSHGPSSPRSAARDLLQVDLESWLTKGSVEDIIARCAVTPPAAAAAARAPRSGTRVGPGLRVAIGSAGEAMRRSLEKMAKGDAPQRPARSAYRPSHPLLSEAASRTGRYSAHIQSRIDRHTVTQEEQLRAHNAALVHALQETHKASRRERERLVGQLEESFKLCTWLREQVSSQQEQAQARREERQHMKEWEREREGEDALRAEIARLTVELAQTRSERDQLQAEKEAASWVSGVGAGSPLPRAALTGGRRGSGVTYLQKAGSLGRLGRAHAEKEGGSDDTGASPSPRGGGWAVTPVGAKGGQRAHEEGGRGAGDVRGKARSAASGDAVPSGGVVGVLRTRGGEEGAESGGDAGEDAGARRRTRLGKALSVRVLLETPEAEPVGAARAGDGSGDDGEARRKAALERQQRSSGDYHDFIVSNGEMDESGQAQGEEEAPWEVLEPREGAVRRHTHRDEASEEQRAPREGAERGSRRPKRRESVEKASASREAADAGLRRRGKLAERSVEDVGALHHGGSDKGRRWSKLREDPSEDVGASHEAADKVRRRSMLREDSSEDVGAQHEAAGKGHRQSKVVEDSSEDVDALPGGSGKGLRRSRLGEDSSEDVSASPGVEDKGRRRIRQKELESSPLSGDMNTSLDSMDMDRLRPQLAESPLGRRPSLEFSDVPSEGKANRLSGHRLHRGRGSLDGRRGADPLRGGGLPLGPEGGL